jgi:hypothetical protein
MIAVRKRLVTRPKPAASTPIQAPLGRGQSRPVSQVLDLLATGATNICALWATQTPIGTAIRHRHNMRPAAVHLPVVAPSLILFCLPPSARLLAGRRREEVGRDGGMARSNPREASQGCDGARVKGRPATSPHYTGCYWLAAKGNR